MIKPYYEEPGIVIYHADCREILPLLDERADLFIADPPFSIPVKYHDAAGNFPRSWGDLAVMEPFFREVFAAMRTAQKDDAQTYICCDHQSYPIFFKAALPFWQRSHLIIWYKPTGRRGNGWKHSHELIMHLATPWTSYGDKFLQDVIGIMPTRTLNREHPAEKPGDLWLFLLQASPAINRLVIDPFMGSGESLLVTRNAGHRAIGIEIEEKYCEIAVRRLQQEVLPLKSDSEK